MTRRQVEKLLEQAKANGDGGDCGPTEVVVEVGGHPPDPLDPDEFDEDDEDGADTEAADGDRADTDRRPAGDERAASFESFTFDLDSGAVETPDPPEGDDLPACSEAGCPNPVMPGDGILSESDRCEKCLGMPRRDWRPVVRGNDDEDDGDREGGGGDDGGDHG